MTNHEIANTILDQLGGRRFSAMTGAGNAYAGERSVRFSIKARAKAGINRVLVELTGNDDYTLTFHKQRGLDCKLVQKIVGVHAEELRPMFTRVTGLETSL